MRHLNLIIFAGGLSWPVFVAEDQGFFAKHNLQVDVTETPGSVFQISGLMEGKFDVAMTPFDNVVAYQEGQGETPLPGTPDLFAFMGGISSTLRLIVSPDVKSFADLKGRTIGVDALTTGYSLAMYKLLDVNGLPPGSYQLARVGGTSFRVQALEQGKVAATMVSSPQEIVPESKGFGRLGDVQSMIGSYQALSGVARRSWAQKHRGEVEDFIKAYVEANEWLSKPENRAAAAQIYLHHIPGTPADVIDKAWTTMLSPTEGFQPKAKFSAQGADTVLDIRRRYGVPKKQLDDWHKYVDETYYEQALSKP